MKKILLFAAMLQGSLAALAQPKADTSAYVQHMNDLPVKSHLSYQTISQFLQANVTTGTNGGFIFKSSLFGLHYLFHKGNDSLSSYYLPHTAGRNTEISIGVNKNGTTTDQLSLITAGIKWTPVNNRDKSFRNFAVEGGLLNEIKDISHASASARAIYATRSVIYRILHPLITDPTELSKAIRAAVQVNTKLLSTASPGHWTQNDLDGILKASGLTDSVINRKVNPVFKRLLDTMETFYAAYTNVTGKAVVDAEFKKIADSVYQAGGHDSYNAYYQSIQKKYNDLAKRIDMGSVLAVSFTPGYNFAKSHWDTTTVAVRYIRGFFNPDKPMNVDAQAMLVSLQDSSAQHNNFGHDKLIISLGLDHILLRDQKENPVLEAEFAGEHDWVFSQRYPHEPYRVTTANLVTTVALNRSFSLPITIKYDPKHAQILGLFTINWNLESSSKSINGGSQSK